MARLVLLVVTTMTEVAIAHVTVAMGLLCGREKNELMTMKRVRGYLGKSIT